MQTLDGKKMNKQNLEKSFSSIFFELFSKHNLRIFVYLFLSFIPAIFFGFLLVYFDILHIKGYIVTIFFQFDFSKYLPFARGVFIQPSLVIISIILVHLGFKIIEWGLLQEKPEKNPDKNPDTRSSNWWKSLPFIIFIIILLAVMIYQENIFWMLYLFLIFLNILLMRKFKNIFLIILLFLIMNFILIYFYYQNVDIVFVVSGEEREFMTFFTKIAYIWLYVYPYNFFIFLPYFAGVIFLNFEYPEEYIKDFFDSFIHKNIVPFTIGIIANIFLCFIPILFVLSAPELPRSFLFQETPIDSLVETLHSIFASEEVSTLAPYQIFTLLSLFVGSFLNWFLLYITNLVNIEENFLFSYRKKLEDTLKNLNNHILFFGINSLNLRIWNNLINANPKKYLKFSQLLGRDFKLWKIYTKALFVDINSQELENKFQSKTDYYIGTFQNHMSSQFYENMVLAASGDITKRNFLKECGLEKTDLIIGTIDQEPKDKLFSKSISTALNPHMSPAFITVAKRPEPRKSQKIRHLISKNKLEAKAIAHAIVTNMKKLEKNNSTFSVVVRDNGSHLLLIWNEIKELLKKEPKCQSGNNIKFLTVIKDSFLLKEAIRLSSEIPQDLDEFYTLKELKKKKLEKDTFRKISFVNFKNSRERLQFLIENKPKMICLFSSDSSELQRDIKEWASCVQICQRGGIYNPVFIIGLDKKLCENRVKYNIYEIFPEFNLIFFDLWSELERKIMDIIS